MAEQRQIKYFLSERDFLTGKSVPKSEVVRKPHIRAEYDDLDRLIVKSYIDRSGKSVNQEQYSYIDTNETIRQKDFVDVTGNIYQQTIFGRESHSVSYIEWVFGVDSVKKWDDRFTTSKLNKINKPDNYRFFDVDAFEYGGKEFDYDSLGRVIRDEWFRRPDGKSMHKFLFKYYDDLDITHMFEYDSNGVLIMDVKLSPDGTEAVFWFTGPPDTSYINTSAISYNLDGDVKWGYLNWVVPGELDSLRVDLTKITRGDHIIVLPDESALKDSFTYNVHFDGEGVKGYMATKRKKSNLIYDISPPIMSLEMDKYMKEVYLSYTSTEPIDSAYIIWYPDSNFADTKSDTVILSSEELVITDRFKPVNQTQLVDGVMYNPGIFAYDRAGNLSNPGVFNGVIYDITPPILTFTKPYKGAWINNQLMGMSTNEPIQKWSIYVKRMGGANDDNSPFYHEFLDTISVSVDLDLSDYFQLNDGSMYTFSIVAPDLAGNVSDTVYLDSIHYDITPPVITMIYPFDDAAINSPAVSYAISEKLLVGEFRWTQIDGKLDSLSPQIVEMVGDELLPKEKIRIGMKNEPVLVDGSTYNILVNGRDLAGNDSEPVSINNILYDITPPSFSLVSPDSGAALNHQNISYTLSEDLFKGEIIWIQTGGLEDPDQPHNVELTKEEMSFGSHDSIRLINMPPLRDGGIYSILFTGSDRAGNIADTVTIKDVLYDFTLPEIAIDYPTNKIITNTKVLSYSLSEDFYEASFTWTWNSGVEDLSSPYVVELTEDEKKKGVFTKIELTNIPDFVENAIYTITFVGRDRAGNEALQAIVNGVEYDFTPPELTWLSPANGDAVNHKNVHYKNSELLNSGEITWTWINGVEDPDSIHTMELFKDELNMGEYGPSMIANAPALIDGGVYNISYKGFDPAGNESNHIKIENILYDITQPEIVILFPLPRSISKTTSVSYTLSETLFEGQFKWIWLGGVKDTLAPYTAILTQDEREVGEHIEIELANNPTVVENALYTMSITGRDRAGNKAKRAFVPGLQYDFTPPELTILSPDTGEAVNHKLVHFSNSEILQSAQMIWLRTGGNEDTLSPHISDLARQELNFDEIGPKELENVPNLNDGSIYTLMYVGYDPAGNISDTVKVEDVLYDITSPIILISYPTSDIYTTESKMIFNINEDLYGFNIFWNGIGKNNKPHEITYLSDDKLLSGEYDSDNLFIPELKDATTYEITLNGNDRAGNKAEEVKLIDIKIDLTPPEFTNFYPKSGSFINVVNIGWSLSEDIDNGIVLFKHSDSAAPLESVLNGPELLGGTRSIDALANYVALRDGRVYEISISGTDFAGNVSETLRVTDITYDTTPPTISILSPQSESFVNTVDITYSTDEPLIDAMMVWTAEGSSPMTFELNKKDFSQGEHVLTDYGVRPEEKVYYQIYINGTDRATNNSISDTLKNVTFDITPPEFVIINPTVNMPVNSTELSFSISEPIEKGTITWEAQGNADPKSPHVREILDKQKKGGTFRNFTFENAPELIDGLKYNISITGTDLAGNKGKKVKVDNILYDITPPEFVDVSPNNDAFINEADISYTLTETLEEGKIYFENIGGSPDPKKSHMVTLAGSKKRKGKQGGKLPASLVRLVNGSIYNVRFEGSDAAGNQSPDVQIDNIVFDNEIPILSITSPSSNSFINKKSISLSISEDLANGQIVLEQISGNSDPKSPHKIVLDENSRKMGTYDNIIYPGLEWVDGAIYNLTIGGEDFAGNVAESIKIPNINFDITPPVISIDNFNDNSYINKNILSYTLSENLANATMQFIQIDGQVDPNSPQTVELNGKELYSGTHNDILLQNGPKLFNGSVYRVEFSGEDFASNQAKSVIIQNLHYDDEAPEISISRPINSEQIKSTVITYLSSENLATADVIFKQTSGTIDVNSPHRVSLNGDELNKGVHTDYDLNITSELADGGRYTVTIEAFDKAGNSAEVVPIEDVFFDLLPPVLSLDSPANGSRINSPLITYSTNEEMGKGLLVFTRVSGSEDPKSPHQVELTGSQLKQGPHYDESFSNQLTLKDGSVYSITFSGQDLAGNIATDVSISNIVFDSSPPKISISIPKANNFYNSINLDFSIDEDLSIGNIIVERTGGASDPSSPHKIDFTSEQLTKGQKTGIIIDQLTNLASNATYDIKIEATDIAGNNGVSNIINKVTFDDIPPEISITSPPSESFINNPSLTLRTNEILPNANVDWVWLEGNPDPTKQHKSNLVGDKLDEGEYPDVNFDPPPKLVSGAWYNVTFNGTDRAGNFSSYLMGKLYFDNIPPKTVGMYPKTDSFINLPEVSYSVDEQMTKSTISWEPSEGTEKVLIELVDNELLSGTFETGSLTNQTDLIDGTVYNLVMKATDQAGNESETTLAKNITFDQTKPKFTQVIPLTSARINSQLLEWNVDEKLSSGKYTWIHMGGSEDSAAPHEYTLTPELLSDGKHDNSSLPDLKLVENAMYRITLEGTDLAGNTGKKFIMSVVYDDVPPSIELKYPETNMIVNNLDISFYISEQLSEGQFIYTRVGGAPDPNSPVTMNLANAELETFFEQPTLPTNPAVLNDGSIYNIQFKAKDLAENASESNIMENVGFDFTRPVIKIFLPEPNTYFIGSEINIDISEDLKEGTIIWNRTGGLNTQQTRYEIIIDENTLKKGALTIPIKASLSSSVIYSLSVNGIDFAGNESEPINIESIEYIRNMKGKWYYKGAIIEVVWVFEPDQTNLSGNFMQGLSLGTKISDEEKGTYTFDFNQKPFLLTVDMEDPTKSRISLVEFLNNNRIRVVTGTKQPKNMTDGEVMEYEWRPD